jgi:hypothetical protein
MGSYLLNSGGLDDEIRISVFRAAYEPDQSGRRLSEPGRQLPCRLVVRHPGGRFGGCLGQTVTGGLLFLRGRRLLGVLSAPVVDPGLRPRFFSVLPTPAKFRSR